MSESKGARKLRIAETVESGVEGLFSFLARYVRTVWVVACRPRKARFSLLADRRAIRPSYVMPFTFAVIGMFLLSLITRVAGTSPLDWIWFHDEIWSNVTERLPKEFSLVTMAIGSVPAMVALLGVAGLIGAVQGGGKRYRHALFVTCYGVGAQCFFIFLVVSGFALSASAGPDTALVEGSTPVAVATYAAIGVMVALVVEIVIGIPWFVCTAMRRPAGRLGSASACVGTFAVLTAPLWIFPLVADLPERLAKAAKPRTAAKAEIVSDVSVKREGEEAVFMFDVLVRNEQDAPFHYETSRTGGRLVAESSGREVILGLGVGMVIDETERGTTFGWVPGKGLLWRRVELHASVPDYRALKE